MAFSFSLLVRHCQLHGNYLLYHDGVVLHWRRCLSFQPRSGTFSLDPLHCGIAGHCSGLVLPLPGRPSPYVCYLCAGEPYESMGDPVDDRHYSFPVGKRIASGDFCLPKSTVDVRIPGFCGACRGPDYMQSNQSMDCQSHKNGMKLNLYIFIMDEHTCLRLRHLAGVISVTTTS